MEEQLVQWVDAYSPALLRWAYGKTGSREGAEELAFRDGTLYHPSSKRDGEFLTLLYVKNGD